MALTRRELLLALTSGMAAASCSRVAAEAQTRTPYRELFEVAARGRDKVLVCMPESSQTEQAWTGLSDELGQEFGLVAVRVEGRSDAAVIEEAVKRHHPRSIVLMNNPTLSAYHRLEKDWPTAKRIPTVSIMTSFLQARSLGPQATGVAYEVPLITSVTQVRRVLANPVDRVGVVFRRSLAHFVAQQRDLAAREKIDLLGAEVSEDPNESEVKGALRSLKHQVHAVWVLNDDRLLTPKLISKGWLPGLNERPWRPTIVGAESLVAAGLSFGTFAVLPDHTELGTQAANIVYDIADGDWSLPPDYPTQEPLSTKSTIDLVQVRERFQLLPDALARVDRVLE